MITTSDVKTTFEPVPYGENSKTHPAIRFVLKWFKCLHDNVGVSTIILTLVVYSALCLWFCGTVLGSASLLNQSIAYGCLVVIILFPFCCMVILVYCGNWAQRIYDHCYDDTTRPLLFETVRIEQIEQFLSVGDLEDFGPGYLVRTRDDEYFVIMSQALESFDQLPDGEDYPLELLPEILELDLNHHSKELIEIRGFGRMIPADDIDTVCVRDLPLQDFPAFRIFSRESLSREVLGMLRASDVHTD